MLLSFQKPKSDVAFFRLTDWCRSMTQRCLACAVALLLSTAPSASWASDLQRESSYADIMQNSAPVGELIWLNAGTTKFIALQRQSTQAKSQGTVIVLHDMGDYPEQEHIAAQLRRELPEHNWSSLAIQLPLRETGASSEDYFALFPEAAQRIQAAVDFLQQQKTETIVLAGYGLGALMGLYAQTEKNFAIKAFVAVSLPVYQTDQKMAKTLDMLPLLKVPLLDIYAAQDLPEVQTTARERRVAAKDNAEFRQMQIEGEDHGFQHQNGLVPKRVYGWLNRVLR